MSHPLDGPLGPNSPESPDVVSSSQYQDTEIQNASSSASTARPSAELRSTVIADAGVDEKENDSEKAFEKKNENDEALEKDAEGDSEKTKGNVEAASISLSGNDLTPPATADEPPYTIFTKPQKIYLVLLASLAGVCSPLSSFIFYPATTSMAASLGVEIAKIDLAVTTYMVVAGIVPALLGSVADQIGRRPVYLFALIVYFAGNLGLALQRSYPALLVLRMVQSAGSAGTIALGFGTVADVTTSADRGFYVGMFLIGPNAANALGPVLGGAIAYKLTWPWIFWFLCMFGGAILVLIFLSHAETGRNIVGNGSIPATGINRTFLSVLRRPRGTHKPAKDDSESSPAHKRFTMPNPISCLALLGNKDVMIVTLSNGFTYMMYSVLQASLSAIFIAEYGYSELNASLIYLPFGVACLLSSTVWGWVLRKDHARTALEHGIPLDRATGARDAEFPVELARLRSLHYATLIVSACTIAYGWVLHAIAHVSIALVLQFILGFAITAVFTALGTLLTDLNPDSPSSGTAAGNIVRCAMSAIGLAIIHPILDAIGTGWCFTFFGLLYLLVVPLLLVEQKVGYKWRHDPNGGRQWWRPLVRLFGKKA